MILCLDTSALMKLFVVEPGSEAVTETEAATVATHLVAYAETRATFARAVRMQRLDAAALGPLVLSFERTWAALDVVGVTEPLVRRAGDLAERHGLRGYDSVHLAAALTLRDLVGSAAEVGFGAFDIQLRSAAEVHGLVLCPSA